MLQPRLPGCGSGKMGVKRNCVRWSFVCVAALLSTTLVSCQDINDNKETIEATRIKREGVPENRDLTVLLVNDQKRNDYSKIGRYHSVKPLIGLLTSTARTFIQDGVTTEFATQILGTTLDNGRIYAQLLTKSSLVLYNKPSNVDDPFIVKPTRVHSAFDGKWNVKQDLGFIDPDTFVLKNTDYLAPSSKMDIIYASKPVQDNVKYWSPPTSPESPVENQILDEPTARRIQPVKEIPRYVQNEALNFLDGPLIDNERKYEFIVQPSVFENVNTLHRQSKAYEAVNEPVKSELNPVNEDIINESNVVKVKPDYDLPTFTIKNEFSPIFYYIDNVESRSSQQPIAQQTKLPKKLFGQKSEPRPKKTFTYSGFADFTTVVGDTVIIFSPNTETSRPQDPNEVNVFPSARPVDKLNTKITFLAADIPVATSTFKPHDTNTATQIRTPNVQDSSETPIYSDEDNMKQTEYEVENTPDSINIEHNSGFDFNLDVIQPSEAVLPITESTRLTDDLGVLPLQDSSSKPTEPLNTLKPSATIIESLKESAVTESNSEIFTHSEEETENTASEVTEKSEEEEDEEEETTTEMESNIVTTTESGHSEESFEELEVTTEFKEDDDDEEDFCTDGLETLSTMTTAYKTLTYLTTYFIPLESTKTTTSVKSDVSVESTIGYLTNVVCRTNLNIQPTAVLSIDLPSSVLTNVEAPETVSEETTTTPAVELDATSEEPSKSIEKEEENMQIAKEEENISTTIHASSDEVSIEVSEEEETETSTTTTTERISTSQNHVEVSVSTEHSTTPTEKTSENPEEEIPLKENEIDLIYKTLYTTYTYFTTFFGDQTSSVASHKSVITNIITSTIDLSQLDPTLLGAFNEDEIAPTSVGIGRPTESFAINSIIDLVKNKDVIESVEIDNIYSSQTPTPFLGDDAIASINPDAVKTYFTTYTFFTTIYVGSDANVCSRSEVYTNYVGPDELIPTKSNPLAVESTRAQFDFRNCKQVKIEKPIISEENSSVESSISMEQENDDLTGEVKKNAIPQPTKPLEVDMLFSVESNPLESENSFTTDVKSSSSRGERKLLDNNNILEDQISSESNIEEIMPSPTLLLQTSYTTFTYFTTMYIGKDSSKVKSRLETITNVVTETIMPKKEPEEESNLPITYYTTFTYWTTLYKDKSTTITSREEIVSNVVNPSVQVLPTVSPIDTTPIDIDSVSPPKELEVKLKPSLVNDNLEQDDGKATFYTTYTYFTTFYAGNTSEIRSSLETVTNIVDNTKVIEDNQLGRKVPSGPAEKNLIQDKGEKQNIVPTVVKEEIKPTQSPDIASASPTVLLGTYIDNLFAEVKPGVSNSSEPDTEKKILFSQVAVISGESTVVTSDNKTLNTDTTTVSLSTTSTTTTDKPIINASPDVIESSVAEPEATTESKEVEEEDTSNLRKKSRLSFTPKKPTFTPVIIPFASRNRPTFNPKRVPLPSSATTITRLDATPTITATPTLKSVRPSGFGANRKQSVLSSSSQGRRFPGRSSSSNLSSNIPSASKAGGFPRGSIQPTSRRTGFRSSSLRSNNLDLASRSAIPRIRPTASSRLRNNRQSATISFPPTGDQNESETVATQQEENATEPLEEASEPPVKTTNNPLLRFRRPPLVRQPGTAITPRSTTPSTRKTATTRGRLTTTTRRVTTRSTTNPLLSLRRQRPNNALFPRRNLFKQPDPEPEEEIRENEQKVEESEELLEEEEDFEEDNDYDSSDRKEQQVATPSTSTPKKNLVSIRPFAFKRRSKRQVDYGNRKYTNFRRPGTKALTTRRPEPEPETEPPAPVTQKLRPGNRYNARVSSNTRTTTQSAPKASSRQPFIIRGESRTTTTLSPAYRRNKSSRPSSRTTTSSSRPKAPRLSSGRTSTDRSRPSSSRSTSSRSRSRTTTSRASSRQRNSFENTSGERFNNLNHLVNDGKFTVTHHVPTEVTIPVVNGKITEYKNVLSATPSIEILLRNQVSTSIGPLGNQQLVLAHEATELAENGGTRIIRYILQETPTTTVIFTPTTIRGRKTSYSHILPSTVYNVEPVTQTIAPEISANVPLANLLLSQLLLGNQQQAINPLLALQGQGLLPQQQVAQTPVTEFRTRSTTYVTTVTDARETVLPITFKAFNTNAIVYDNSPWRPGRDIVIDRPNSEEDERRLKNLATKIMSNGVEVLVKDKNSDGKQEQTKYMEVKTIQPSAPISMFASSFPKIEKRIDNQDGDGFDLIQPSEVGHTLCTTSCSCSHTKTEGLKTKYTNIDASAPTKYGLKTSKYGATKMDLRPTNKESLDKKTQYPYEYESNSQLAPTDKIVEKYTEVINDYSDEKDTSSVEETELLTNEQAPAPLKNKLSSNNKNPDKTKPEKPQKPNKNKFVVADLLKLGSLGIKGLSQLAPVIEKMTGGFIKRQDTNKTTTTTTTTIKPAVKLTAYNVNKRVDTDIELKPNNFPIYIPVDELETSESQIAFTNATLHQNLAWAAEHKQPKSHIVPPKIVHESPLVNGGIPISPGEIITANSDVIVGKPAVGGPLTLAASGIKFQNPVNPPIDSFVAGNEEYSEKRPYTEQALLATKVDDSFDLRPPQMPRVKPRPNRVLPRLTISSHVHQNIMQHNNHPHRIPLTSPNDHLMKTEQMKNTNTILGNHGRPAFLDYIPSLAKPTPPATNHANFLPLNDGNKDEEIPDNSPSSSEIINTRIRTDGDYALTSNVDSSKPFLVDIQPSRVANVLIPHGSSTALVFAGSSEPHKTGDYVDDPLPYPEPGYFGSFSIDAPQMTNVHNVAPNNNKQFSSKPSDFPSIDTYKPLTPPHKDQPYRNDLKLKWKDNKRPSDFKIPPPTSNQETHIQVGPHITAYNPDIYNSNNGEFIKYSHVRGNDKQKNGKEVIDKEYENYLAVPPPPPKMHYNGEAGYDKNKQHHQRPVVHTKPIQDMKVFLNIQHPVPNKPNFEQSPPKVTSEIYFAAQAPNSKPTPTYTIHIPSSASSPPLYGNPYTQNNVQSNNVQNVHVNQGYNGYSELSSSNIANKSILANEISEKENTYTVTLNTATNVASNVGETGQVIGSSVPVPVGISSNVGQLNTDIPIGTNFAIRVEDGPAHIESYNLQENQNHHNLYEKHIHPHVEISLGDNRWNKSTPDKNVYISQNDGAGNDNDQKETDNIKLSNSQLPTLNSHANFPMINEYVTPGNIYEEVKPVTEYADDEKISNQQRPAKLIPNIPTNSHGWYSSVLINENTLSNINNIKVEPTTRKVIPLSGDYNTDNLPAFGQKISSVGKPPSEFWPQNGSPGQNVFNIGKPFTKLQTEKTQSYTPHLSDKPYLNYIPSNFGTIKQPAYDIPIRDNSDETTTTKTVKSATEKVKPVYENSEEIYDGEDDPENMSDIDGEISLESMKVPVVSSSSEKDPTLQSSTELSLLQDEIISPKETTDKNVQLVNFNPGTQTEKPFKSSNNTNIFQSNSIKPIYEDSPYMRPRPFTISSATTLDHQLQQPHWQINQLMENSTNVSYEENLELNIGEELGTASSTKRPLSTQRIPPYRHNQSENKYKRPPRPVFSRPINGSMFNDSNIITSTVHIQDKKPLIVEKPVEKPTLPPYTFTTIELNRSSSEIINLSPPPPTMDYNFKPSTNDETIMGMSPPPPQTPPTVRPPNRMPITPRPLPVRTPPPYRTKPPRTIPPRVPVTHRPIRKPSRDEVSTYRPSYDILNNVRRPTYNRDQPSSQLLPPPREIPSRVIHPMSEVPAPTVSVPTVPNLVFPTPISSGWLTSSGVDFSSSFNFDPTSIQFPGSTKPLKASEVIQSPSSEISYSYETETSSEQAEQVDISSSEKPLTEDRVFTTSKEVTIDTTTKKEVSSTEENVSDSDSNESSLEDITTDKMKVIPIGNKNRTRKPYPVRNDEKKTSTSKYKLPPRPTSFIKPTRTLSRPEILYPTRHLSTRKIIRPIPTRSSPESVPPVVATNIIESSETFIDDQIIKPTEVLKAFVVPTISQLDITSSTEKSISSIITPNLDEILTSVKPTHHAGNEIKISDEVIPTKTEFRTTVVTLTKTLSEPALTVSSINFVNLTHTLTVTHTKTSLLSQSEGAVTQTLVLTNTHTSTIVDVVTEIHTQVQPTTIIETVTKHIPIPQVEPTPVKEVSVETQLPLDDISMSFEDNDNLIIKDNDTTENIQKIETESEGDNDTFFVVMNKSQNGGQTPTINTDIETGDYDGVTRNEQVNSNGVSQVLFGEILLAGTPFLETTNVVNAPGVSYGKECQPDCKASRNERCQRIDGIMKCVCRPGFARMFPDRPCKPTYTYSVKLALGSQGNERLQFHESLSDNSSKQYHALAVATHEGINRMVMQSDLRDVYHGVHITGFQPVQMKKDDGETYQGVINDFYVQLSDNAHESRLKEVIEKYLRTNNYSLGGTDVHAAADLVDRLDVSDFDECTSGQFHDCSEHAQCFNLRGTYTCSCLEGYADLSVNNLYPGRICSAEPVGCERCNYHGACYSRDDRRVLCECFQWYAGSSCQINLKVVLISLVVAGALLSVVLAACAILACSRPRRQPRSIVACIQSMPSLHQGAIPSKQRADRRALISERGESGDASSVQNASLPYMPSKRASSSKKCVISDPPTHEAPPPPPAPAVMIPRARLHPHHGDSRENISKKLSLELSSEAKLISYLESGAANNNEEMRRKHSMESSYSANKERHNKQGALVSAGFKVSTTIRPDETAKDDRDDLSSVHKADLEADLARFDSLRKSYSQEDISEWTDAERRIGELTLSEARSVGGTLPASTGRAASSTRLTHQEANTMAERDLGSTFLLPHVHLYKPDLTSDVSEFDSL